jgi:hypothetical protein
MNQGFAAARERGHRAAIICLDPDRVKEVKTDTGMRLGRMPRTSWNNTRPEAARNGYSGSYGEHTFSLEQAVRRE